MTVLAAGAQEGDLLVSKNETPGEHGEVNVTFGIRRGTVHADLTAGANVTTAQALLSNSKIANRGVIPHGAGFLLTPDEALALGWGSIAELDAHIRDYRNGKDLADQPRGVKVIDLYGLNAEEVRDKFPALYQWMLERVKPERDVHRDKDLREKWWLHRRTNEELRRSIKGLSAYVATGQVAKHRTFQFLDSSILPDDKLIAIALPDASHLGVLSSRVHTDWALATGGTLEDRPVYSKSTCFDTFPFPDQDTGFTPALRSRIATLAEQIDAHRKKVLGQAGAEIKLTLTGLYNVLEALKAGRELTAKEKQIHTQGLVGVLKDLHDELDAAVLQAYGWSDLGSAAQDTPELLTRLVTLNARRAAEEKAGTVRWLRPEFQNPANPQALSNKELIADIPQAQQASLALDTEQPTDPKTDNNAQPWPATLPEQVCAVAAVLGNSPSAMPISAIEASFKGRGPWKKSLPRILETLEALGRARREGDAWRGQS